MKSAQNFYWGPFEWGAYVCVKWVLLTGALLSVHALERGTQKNYNISLTLKPSSLQKENKILSGKIENFLKLKFFPLKSKFSSRVLCSTRKHLRVMPKQVLFVIFGKRPPSMFKTFDEIITI